MRRCNLFISFFVFVALIGSSPASGASLRMGSREFAVLCSDGSLQAVQGALDAGSLPTEQVLITAAYSNPDPDVMRLLLSRANRLGLDFKRYQQAGASVLTSAIRGGRPEVVRAVMSFGVNVNARDKSRTLPLSEALRYGVRSEDPKRQEIISILRSAGARR